MITLKKSFPSGELGTRWRAAGSRPRAGSSGPEPVPFESPVVKLPARAPRPGRRYPRCVPTAKSTPAATLALVASAIAAGAAAGAAVPASGPAAPSALAGRYALHATVHV